MNRFQGKESKMIVGVSFDETTDGFLKNVKSIAKRLDMHVHLTHVCKSWVDHPLMVSFPAGYYSYSVASSIDKEEIERSEKKLAELASMFSSDGVQVSTNVLLGHVSQGLIAEAASERASLIVCSTTKGTEQFMPKGFSTALNLMTDSSLPILVIPANAKADFSVSDLKIFLADDLAFTSDAALEATAELAEALKSVSILHGHVGSYSEDELRNVGDKILEAMTAGKIPFDDKFKKTDILTSAKQQIQKRLDERMQPFEAQITTSGSKCKNVISNGDVMEEIEKSASDADMLVFGHHEFYHKKPFTLGKVPFRAMLSMKKPVFMIPAVKKIS